MRVERIWLYNPLLGTNLMTTFTKTSLFINQAPSFGFQYGEDELLAKALKSGFVKKTGDDQYEMNDNYESKDTSPICNDCGETQQSAKFCPSCMTELIT